MTQWMEMLDIDHVIATRYSVLFAYYSLNACSSLLPLVAINRIQDPENEVTIFFLQDMSHYISVYLLENFSLPPVIEINIVIAAFHRGIPNILQDSNNGAHWYMMTHKTLILYLQTQL